MTTNSSKDLSVWERLEQGRQVKAINGGYIGYGSPAFGQRAVNGELVEDPLECEIVELIRRHHKSGKSLQNIADWLNARGYTTKRGQQWQRISVKRVLDRLYGKVSRISGVTVQIQQNSEVSFSPSGDVTI
jgi:DNA invertase Pin-like site-specific DNA recombinase